MTFIIQIELATGVKPVLQFDPKGFRPVWGYWLDTLVLSGTIYKSPIVNLCLVEIENPVKPSITKLVSYVQAEYPDVNFILVLLQMVEGSLYGSVMATDILPHSGSFIQNPTLPDYYSSLSPLSRTEPMTPTSEKRSPSKKPAVSSMSPAEVYMLQRLNVEDATYSVNEEVMGRVKFLCDLMNKMLDNYNARNSEKTHYVFVRLCSTEGLDDSAEITREGHQTINIQHSILDPDPIAWESKLKISWTNGTTGSVSHIPINLESSLTARWGPNLEETDGTYCHTLSPDFDLEFVKAIFNP